MEPLHPIQFLPWDDNLFILQSQRDGYNHLYIYNKEGQLQRQLTSGPWVVEDVTSGPWVVEDVLGFSKKNKSIVIVSNEKNAIQRNIFSVDIKTGKRTLLDNGRGSHRGELSESGRFLVDRYTEPDVPRNIDVITIHSGSAAGKSTRLLTAADPWADYQKPIFECGTIKAADGQTDLYYRMVKPHDFDPAKQYPTVVYVYGGPHAHNVEAPQLGNLYGAEGLHRLHPRQPRL